MADVTDTSSAAATQHRDAVSLTGNDLHLSFGKNHVLRGISLDVDAGGTTTVIGPSGSGKSTLLRVLNRLHEPDSGDIPPASTPTSSEGCPPWW